MMTAYAIPFSVALTYIAVFALAVLMGFWMGRKTVGEVTWEQSDPEMGDTDEPAGDLFLDAMQDDEQDRRSTL